MKSVTIFTINAKNTALYEMFKKLGFLDITVNFLLKDIENT